MVVEALPQGQGRARRILDGFRAKLSEMLEDSRIWKRRAEDAEARASRGGGGINVPASAIVGFVMYLVAQTGGIIWWAATMQARVDHAESDRGREEQRLWDSINNYHLEINALRLDIARVQGAQSIPVRPSRFKGDQ